MPERSDAYQLPSWPKTLIDRLLWNSTMADIHERITAREELEASFESLKAQGIQASLDYIQVNVAPQIANLQTSIDLAQQQIDQIIVGGKAPDTLRFGGQLPVYYATAQALSQGLAEKVPNNRKVNGKELSADIALEKADVGLGSVNNTADADKPVSDAQRLALDAKISGPKLLSAPGLLGRLSNGEGPAELLTKVQANQFIGGWEPIADLKPNGFNSVALNNLSSFYMIRIIYRYLVTGNAAVRLWLSNDNGSTFINGQSNYAFSLINSDGPVGGSGGNSTASSSAGAIDGFSLGDDWTAGEMTLQSFNAATERCTSVSEQRIQGQISPRINSRLIVHDCGIAAAHNALLIYTSNAQPFEQGRFFVEGRRG